MKQNRPPIVVILGHVDHGKTSLLDYLRKSNVAASEAGGITQHIRSFQLITPNSSPITFIDTPGHAAFSAMRQRGSNLADIAILVISGADGVMPQTIESIEDIKSSGIPFVVAITKSDLGTSNPDKVKTELSQQQVFVEEMGGHTPSVSLSVKTGQGISELLEILSLLTELNPPQADPETIPQCIVLESRLDSQKGPLASVVITSGTLKVGQNLFQNTEIGKVRALIDPDGKNISQALPSQPVEILGLKSVPEVGSLISGSLQVQTVKPKIAPPTDANAKIQIILKTDVIGSQEAISWSIPEGVSILSSATGDVTENDILSASANHSRVIAFNVRCSANVAKLAEVEKVQVHTFKIIYELLDYLRNLIDPKVIETVLGKAQITAEFKINGDHVAGCRVIEGKISKIDLLKIMRSDQELGQVKFKSFKTGKTDLVSTKTGTEFGAVFSPPLDFKVDDTIIAFTLGHG